MQLSRQEVLPDLPDSVLWKLARFLPDHQTGETTHGTFCLLGRSWRNAYCSSRDAVTLHLGQGGLQGLARRVLAGSGGTATRLEMHVYWRAQAQLVAAALRSLPKLQVLLIVTSDSMDTEFMAAVGPALGALHGLTELNFHTRHMGAADTGELLAHALQRLSGLQHLHLSWDCMAAAGVAAMAHAIQQLTGLLSLDLGNTDVHAAEVAPAIQHLTSLQKLVCKGGRMKADGTAAVAHALRHLGGLQELTLSGCGMDGDGMLGPLALAIGGLTVLRQLRFTGDERDGNALDAEDAHALAQALAQRTGLQLLHLSHQHLGILGPEVDQALASALHQLTGLTDLDFYDTCLDAWATATLAPALGRLTGLVSLSIGFFKLVDADGEEDEEDEEVPDAAAELAPALAALTQLTRLHLHGEYLSTAEDRGMAALAFAVGGLVQLRNLGIRDSGLGACGTRAVAALARTVHRLPQLQVLDLSFSRLCPAGAAALAPALRRLSELRHLDMSFTRLGDRGVEVLAPALARLTGLTHLDLSGNDLGEQGMAAAVPLLLQLTRLRYSSLDR